MHNKLKRIYEILRKMSYFKIPSKQGDKVDECHYGEFTTSLDDAIIYIEKDDSEIFKNYKFWYCPRKNTEGKFKITSYIFYTGLEPEEFPLEITKQDILNVLDRLENILDEEAVKNVKTKEIKR
jgi:hypothetical protein